MSADDWGKGTCLSLLKVTEVLPRRLTCHYQNKNNKGSCAALSFPLLLDCININMLALIVPTLKIKMKGIFGTSSINMMQIVNFCLYFVMEGVVNTPSVS